MAARVKEDVSRMDNEFATLAEAPGEDFRVCLKGLGSLDQRIRTAETQGLSKARGTMAQAIECRV